MRKPPYSSTRWLAAAALAAALCACGPSQSELRAYVDEVKARPGGRIEPLPEIRPAPSFVYEAGDRRSPFMPDVPQRSVRGDSLQGPDENRPPQTLEQYPLDTLRMVGTLDSRGEMVGLVQSSDGLVHRVAVGAYMGQNDGRVLAISESEIQLVEIIADGLGGYLERPAGIGISD